MNNYFSSSSVLCMKNASAELSATSKIVKLEHDANVLRGFGFDFLERGLCGARLAWSRLGLATRLHRFELARRSHNYIR